MKCHDCPYSLVCLSGRLDQLFVMTGLCPECKRLYGLVDRVVEDKLREERRQDRDTQTSNVPLDYERHLDLRYQREYMSVFIPAPRTTIIAFKCEKRSLQRTEQQRWRYMAHKTQGRYQYTSGWSSPDPAGLLREPVHIRPCPECCRWPEHHIIEDLDAQEKYEAEKKGSTPAFRLKGRRHQGR